MSRCREAGVTLVEALVAVAVGGLVLVLAWDLFIAHSRQGRRTEATLEGVDEASQFVRRFEDDFRRLYWDRAHPIELEEVDAAGVSFERCDAEASDLERGCLRTVRVAYWLDRATRTVWRQAGDATPERLRGRFEALVFRLTPPPQGLLTYLVTAAPEEQAARDGTTLWGSLPLGRMSGERRYEHWRPCPTSFVPGSPEAVELP